MSIVFNLLNSLLGFLFTFTKDWGLAIVALTVTVKFILLPLSIKQKISLREQQNLSKRMEEIKEKHKNDKKRLEEETQKCYQENSKSMFGCLMSFVQLPIIITLYKVIMKMPMQTATVLIPWVTNLKLPDGNFVIPAIYLLVSLSSTLIPYVKYFKTMNEVNINKVSIIMSCVFSLMVTLKTPIAIGIYFITTGVFSLFEELVFRIYMKRKCFN